MLRIFFIMTIQDQYRRLMKPFLIRIIVESVIVVIIALIFLAIYISRLTLTRWEPRIPEAPPCTIHYPKEVKDRGSGDTDEHPVLLIHGFASSPSTFHPTHCIQPLLQEGRSVVLVSYRARSDGPDVDIGRVFTHSLFGCLPRSALPVSIETMAADLVVLIKERGWERVHVVGHSMGGMVAQALAIEVPERIASLTTIGSCVGPGLGPCVPRVGRLLWDGVRVLLPRLREQMLGEDVDTEAEKAEPNGAMGAGVNEGDGNQSTRDELLESEWEAKASERRESQRKQARSEWGHRQLAAIITSRGRARKLDSLVRRGRLRAQIVAVSGALDERIAPRSSTVTGQRITGCRSYVVGGMSHTPQRTEWTEVLRLAGLVRSNTKQASA
jgi:pimeloyl-ACP methyl ester carboxylesterase